MFELLRPDGLRKADTQLTEFIFAQNMVVLQVLSRSYEVYCVATRRTSDVCALSSDYDTLDIGSREIVCDPLANCHICLFLTSSFILI